MPEPWEAEVSLEAEQVAAVVADHWPALAGLPVRALAQGWDNAVFRVGDELLFRFPRREVAVGLLESERAALPLLAGATSLPVPELLHVGEHAGWPFLGYRYLPGRTGEVAAPDAPTRCAGAARLGRFLAELHGLDADAARTAGVPEDSWRRLDLPYRIERCQPRIDQAIAQGLIDGREPIDALVAELPPGWVPRRDTLVHGDLYARNMLVDERGLPCGVIDFGDVHVGDPAVDLALAFNWLPPEGRDAFRRAYGPIDPTRWLVARFRAVFHGLVVGLYGLDIGDAAIAREARLALDFALARD